MYSLQYGEKSPALEVEAGSDVADDLGVRVSCSHESDLPLEVFRLLPGRDAAIADCDGGLCVPDVRIDVISALVALCPDVADASLACPGSQCLRVNAEYAAGFPGRNVPHEYITR